MSTGLLVTWSVIANRLLSPDRPVLRQARPAAFFIIVSRILKGSLNSFPPNFVVWSIMSCTERSPLIHLSAMTAVSLVATLTYSATALVVSFTKICETGCGAC